MAANIETILYSGGIPVPGAPTLQGASRDDLRKGYEVRCRSVDAATTYSWVLSYIPNSPGSTNIATPNTGTQSAAVMVGANLQSATFTLDYEGSYLLRLTVDAGLSTEDTQFVRCRYLTKFGDLKMVAAGERRDGSGVVPVDADASSWANDQNQNLQRLMLMTRRVSTSGRVLYVDANRGRDRSNSQSDEDNLVWIPGTDSAASEQTGTKFGAEGFADFSSINSAIAYAAAAATRAGEVAPSFDDPYWIVIRPGYYQEDLTLAAHVHLIGDEGVLGYTSGGSVVYTAPVIIETTSSGAGPHTFAGTGGLTDPVLIQNIILLNTQDTTDPCFSITGGVVTLKDSFVLQEGAHASQGPAISAAHATVAIELNLEGSTVLADSADPVISMDGNVVGGAWKDSVVNGGVGVNSIEYNETLYTIPASVFRLDRCQVGAVRECGTSFSAYDSYIKSLAVDGFGAGAKTGTMSVTLSDVLLNGAFTYDTAGAAGNTALYLGDVTYLTGPGTTLVFTTANPTTFTRLGSHGESLPYQSDYAPPEDTTDVIPAAQRLPTEYDNIQRAVDYLVKVAHPLAAAPWYSLSTAYDGLATRYPYALGAGLGRTIVADDGAVQIQGNPAPTEPYCAQLAVKNGGFQVEGIVDLGPVITPGTPTTDTNTDVGPSEIQLNPNPGAGPLLSMGRTLFPNDIATNTDRGLPAGLVRGYVTDTEDFYHLHMRTMPSMDPAGTKLAHVVLHAGSTTRSGTADAGHVHIEAGQVYDSGSAGASGIVFLAPGTKGTDEGAVRICGLNGSNATLIAGVFVGGVAGTFWVASPYGIEAFDVLIGDAIGDVITTINTDSRYFIATNDGPGSIRLTLMEPGPNGDVLYITDHQAGALNTALGDFQTAGAAVFTVGDYGDTVALSCPADATLQVHGILLTAGSIGAYTSVTNAVSPYTVLVTDEILGCQTATGVITINLPNTFAVGTKIVIKDEDALASVSNITVTPQGGALIEGAANVVVNINLASLTVYFNGTDWFIY